MRTLARYSLPIGGALFAMYAIAAAAAHVSAILG